jgi:hypothetical protein
MFHGLPIAKLVQSVVVPATAEAVHWPQYRRNLADYPAFVKKWKLVRQKCSMQLENNQLCEIFWKKCMSPVIARRLAYFFNMCQVWDFLDVAVEKPRRAMEACVVDVVELKPVKQADSDHLQIRYEELRAIGERAKME